MLRLPTPPSPLELIRKPVFHACLPIRHLPFSLQALALKQALLRLAGEAIAEGDFDCLIHRRVRISVVDAGLSWNFGLDDRRRLQITAHTAVDTEIRGAARDFLAITTQQVDPDTLFFQRRLVILGDVALGHEIKNLFDAQDLSKLPARLTRILAHASQGMDRVEHLRQQWSEALRYQDSLLP